jgi:hypothetical protein
VHGTPSTIASVRDPTGRHKRLALLHLKGGDVMKKLSVRKLETVKTTAALYGMCPR